MGSGVCGWGQGWHIEWNKEIKYNSSMQLLLKCYWYLSCLQLSCACLVIRRLDYILNEVNEKVK